MTQGRAAANRTLHQRTSSKLLNGEGLARCDCHDRQLVNARQAMGGLGER